MPLMNVRQWRFAGLLVLTACTSTQSPSIGPSSTATASIEDRVEPSASVATPEPDRQPSWVIQATVRDVAFASDGTAYVAVWELGESTSALEARATDGSTPTGWPIALDHVVRGMAVDKTDDVVAIECDYPASRACDLHRFQTDGSESSGWPVPLPGQCFELLIAPDDVIVINCEVDGDSVVVALQSNGQMLEGWPVTNFRASGLTADGSVYGLGQTPGAGLQAYLFGRDGTPQSGWPVELPAGAGGVVASANGSLAVWWMEGVPSDQICLEAERTLIMLIGPDGTRITDIPVSFAGFGSVLVIADDGSLWMRMDGAKSAIIGLGPDGTPLANWPVSLPPDG